MTPTNAVTDLLPHDIPDPLPYWECMIWFLKGYPFWVCATFASVMLLLLTVLICIFAIWIRRRRHIASAKEIALAALARARSGAEQAAPYLFSIEVCDVLRGFLSAEHHLPATTQTSYEFLQTARSSSVFDAVRLEHLARFLDKADAIKFARAAASAADNLELIGLAEDLVKGDRHADAS
ncbi:MAG: hypothetical protein ACKOKC_12620 [Chthoniobacterales bacterium]